MTQNRGLSLIILAGHGVPADDRVVGQAGQQVGVEMTRLAMVAGEVGEIDGGAQVCRIEGLDTGVAGAGVSEEAVAGKQGANVELDIQVIRQRFRDLATQDKEVIEAPEFGVLAGNRQGFSVGGQVDR